MDLITRKINKLIYSDCSASLNRNEVLLTTVSLKTEKVVTRHPSQPSLSHSKSFLLPMYAYIPMH